MGETVATMEAAFDELFAWIKQCGLAQSELHGVPFRWKRDEWSAAHMTNSPVGEFKYIRHSDGFCAYLRPAQSGYGCMRRIDLRSGTTPEMLVEAAKVVTNLRARLAAQMEPPREERPWDKLSPETQQSFGRFVREVRDAALPATQPEPAAQDVEALAQELSVIWRYAPELGSDGGWRAVARHVLARERHAVEAQQRRLSDLYGAIWDQAIEITAHDKAAGTAWNAFAREMDSIRARGSAKEGE